MKTDPRTRTHYLPCYSVDKSKTDSPNTIRVDLSHNSTDQCFMLAVSPAREDDGLLRVTLSKLKFAALGAGRGSEPRFNAKKLSAMDIIVEHEIVTKDQTAVVWSLINQTLEENNLVLQEIGGNEVAITAPPTDVSCGHSVG